MKIIRKATALLMAAFIVIRVLVFNTFAASAAPVLVAGELLELFASVFGEAVLGLDYSEQINDMDWNTFEYNLKEKMNSPSFNITGHQIQQLKNNANNFKHMGALSALSVAALLEWLKNLGEDDIIPTPTFDGNIVDMHGNGAMLEIRRGNYVIKWWAEYITYYSEQNCTLHGTGASASGNVSEIDSKSPSRRNVDGLSFYTISGSSTLGPITYIRYYGDVRTADGTDVDTGEEELPIIGEIDGEGITLDMLDPDGTITKDGVTYNPDDFIDWDKFNTDAIIDLLERILEKIDSLPVVDEKDNALSDEKLEEAAVDLDIAELNNLVAPPAIANVFPFCLPWDFVRGLKLLAAKPVAPKFEIPFNIPEFGLFEGYKGSITLDMSKYSQYFQVARWVQVVLFMIGLCFISFKVVKGVH